LANCTTKNINKNVIPVCNTVFGAVLGRTGHMLLGRNKEGEWDGQNT